MVQENLKKIIEEESKYGQIPYKLGEKQITELNDLYQQLNIQEEARPILTEHFIKLAGHLNECITSGLKHRINNILSSYSLIQEEGKNLPSFTEIKDLLQKIPKILNRFYSNRDLTIDYSDKIMPMLKLADILKEEGL